MSSETEILDTELARDEAYFDDRSVPRRTFDGRLLQEPVTLLPHRPPIVLPAHETVGEAVSVMQARHRGCIVITEDGTIRSPLVGIFTERDVLLKVLDRGRDAATLLLEDVMTVDPEALPLDARLAWALNVMSVGGFRHLPVTDERGWPVFIISVRDIVEFLVDAFPAEILNLPPDFTPTATRTRDGA